MNEIKVEPDDKTLDTVDVKDEISPQNEGMLKVKLEPKLESYDEYITSDNEVKPSCKREDAHEPFLFVTPEDTFEDYKCSVSVVKKELKDEIAREDNDVHSNNMVPESVLGSATDVCNKQECDGIQGTVLKKISSPRQCEGLGMDAGGKSFNPEVIQKDFANCITCTGDERFMCKICNKSFAKRRYLVDHFHIHSNTKPFRCQVCDRSFARQSLLNYHIRTHSGDKPFICEVCSKSFTRSSDVVRHARTHTGDKPFNCKLCEKRFSFQSSLVDHVRLHTGDKQYSCDVCSKSFVRLSYLQNHARIHTGDKPFKCEVCNRGFARKSSLVVHTRTHTGEKPFRCEVCNKGFAQSIARAVHARTHTGDKPFKCKVCNKLFSSRSSFNKHSREHTRKICLKDDRVGIVL